MMVASCTGDDGASARRGRVRLMHSSSSDYGECKTFPENILTSCGRMSCPFERQRRPSYTCTPFPYKRNYAVRRKHGGPPFR
ncbi:unnamed protein product [Bemisia tabaci]|uniref:Uncharacterized protein n=1 Tax=Bemisia tabaci TaxID=7038 RepID=A0A9P0F1B8_BEMTA|nr:unnamed protein product [Bemisia tabaci]